MLKKLAKLVNVVVDPESQSIDLISVIEELEKVTEEELDFRVEANNTKFFRENCIEDEEKITCPTVIDDLTTERIFTMTFVDGYTCSHKDRMIKDGYDTLAIGQTIAESFIHQVFDVGTFHADPHQGNIMISNGKPYWIDFGMIGHINEKDIDTIQTMVIALLNSEADDLVNAIISLGASSPKTNKDKLTEDSASFISKYSGTKSLGDINMSDLLDEILDIASDNHIKLPGQFSMLARAILVMEGVIEQLSPELDLFQLLSDKMIERAKKKFNLKQSFVDLGKDFMVAGKKSRQNSRLAY